MQQRKPVGRGASLAVLLVILTGTLLLAVTWFYWGPRWTGPAEVAATNPAASAIPLDIPALKNPLTVGAERADLPDNEMVLGVVLEGQARAYQRAALGNMHAHVIQDEIGAQTLFVTHCSRTRCTRVFVAPPGESPEVRLGGWRADQTMELIVGTERFSQQAGDIPLSELSFVEVSWAEWKRLHPGTSVLRKPRPSEQVRS